jgi:hypothetical protein
MMSFLLTLLLIYLLYLLLRPLIRMVIAITKARQGDLSGFADMFTQPGSQRRDNGSASQQQRRRRQQQPYAESKKKINKDVGEYVAFDDVTLSHDEVDAANRAEAAPFTAEQQVSDAEWEDVQ